jgi:PAS domain S-box-containing protein
MELLNLQKELNTLILNDDSQFEFLREATPKGLWIRNLKNPSEAWMDSLWWKELGYSESEIPVTHEQWCKIVNEEDMQLAGIKLQKHLENPANVYEQVLPYKQKNGELKWIFCKGVATLDENGLPHRLVGSHEFVEKMREREELLSLCNRQAQIGYWQYEVETDSLEVSLEFRRIVGISLNEEVSVDSVLTFFHPDDRDFAKEQLAKCINEQSQLELDLRLLNHSNEIKWMKSLGTPIANNGKTVKIVGTFQDIHQQKTREMALVESRGMYQNLLNLISDVVVQFDNEGNLLFVSNQWEVLLGFKISDCLGKNIFDFVHEKDRVAIKEAVLAYDNVKDRVLIFRILTKNGEVKWFRGAGRSIENEKGDRIGFQTVIGDLTEFVEIQQALDEKTEQIKNIFNESSEVIWSVKVPENTMIYINPAIENLYELPVVECLNDAYYWTKYIHPADRHLIQTIIDTVNRTGSFSHRFRLLMPDGRIKWVENRGKMVYENEKPIRAHGIMVDRTKQVETEKLLDEEIRLQQILLRIASVYINCNLNGLDETINTSLAEIGQFVGADRVYIFDYDFQNEVAKNTYEWCEKGISSEIHNLQEVSFNLMPDWIDVHLQNQPFHVPDVDTLPAELHDFKQHLKDQNIQSLITIPLISNGELLGFVGFDQVKKKRFFTQKEINLLVLFGQMLVNVFERKSRVEQLEKQEEKYRNIISNMRLGILEVDKQDHILFANQSFLDMSGYELNQIIGKEATLLLQGQEEKARMLEKLKNREKGISDIYEVEITNKSGEKRWWLVSGAPNYNDKGQYIGSIGINLDISEQKRLEREIAYSESLFRTLFDSAPFGIALKDYKSGKYLNFNQRFLEMVGYSFDELYGENYHDITPEYYHPLDMEAEHEMGLKGYFQAYRKSFLKKNGKELPIEIRGAAIDDLDGNKRIWAFIEDISERVGLEKAIQDESGKRKRIAEDLIILKEQYQEYIYRELHDGVNQLLFASKLNLENSGIENEFIDNAKELLHLGIEEIRKIALESTSHFVEERGFATAITEYILRLNNLNRIRFSVDNQVDEAIFLPTRIQKNLFRICQELAQNALKHSKAERMSFRIKTSGNTLILIAKDNGVGFANELIPGIGMKSITDRIYLIGGEIRFINYPGKGFGVCILVKFR